LEHLWSLYWWQPIESHNGYIEVYLNLGLIGLALLALMVLSAYRNVSRVKLSEIGPLRVAFFVAGLAYNCTEAAIHTTNLIWVFFMLSIFVMPKSFPGKPSSVADEDEQIQQNTHRFMPSPV
jgi:O-antigen ligase